MLSEMFGAGGGTRGEDDQFSGDQHGCVWVSAARGRRDRDSRGEVASGARGWVGGTGNLRAVWEGRVRRLREDVVVQASEPACLRAATLVAPRAYSRAACLRAAIREGAVGRDNRTTACLRARLVALAGSAGRDNAGRSAGRDDAASEQQLAYWASVGVAVGAAL